MARLYTFDATALDDDELFAVYLSEVSPWRREKTEAVRPRRSKNLSLAATLALDAGLRELGLREKDRVYGLNRWGKPCFTDRSDIHFSLTHSGAFAAAAVSVSPVGCDAEAFRAADMSVARRFFHPEEVSFIEAQEDRSTAFCRLWTLKESFVKALGTGLYTPLSSFRIVLDGGARVEQSLIDAEFSFEEFRCGNYFIAVCEQNN